MKLSQRQTRWIRRAAAAAEFYAGLMILLLAFDSATSHARETTHSLRILLDHQQVQATVTDIHRRASSLNVGFAFRTLDDVPVLLRRDLAPSFVESHGVGDQVTVQYWVKNPSIGRIKDWDLDRRQSFLIPLLLLLAWLGVALMLRAGQRWRGEAEPRTRVRRIVLTPLRLIHALVRRLTGRQTAVAGESRPQSQAKP